MGSDNRKKDVSIINDIIENSSEYDFYQIAHLLENMNPKAAPLGEKIDPANEEIRFNGNFNLGFPSGDIQKIQQDDKEKNPYQILVNFFGLGGAFGPLPISYTNFILERYWQKDRAINRFFDNFNHRLISLIYRVLKTHKPTADGTSVESERFALHIFSILGLGNNFLKNRMSIHDRSILNFAGLFSRGSYSSRGLECVLSGYFKFPVTARPLRGGWGRIPEHKWTYIGTEGNSGKNNDLGGSFLLGTRAWLQQSKFDVELGPLSFTEYLDILPMGNAFKPLCDCVKFYVGQEFDFDLKATLKPDAVPKIQLGGKTEVSQEEGVNIISEPRLSWSFILRSPQEEPSEKTEELSEETVVILSDKLNNDDYFDYLGDNNGQY